MSDPAPCAIVFLGALADAFVILQALVDEPFTGAAALSFIRLSQWAAPHYARYIEVRGRVAAEHGERVAEGRYFIPPEKVAAYDAAMAPTRSEGVEFDAALQLGLADLADVRISPLALMTLRPFVAGL